MRLLAILTALSAALSPSLAFNGGGGSVHPKGINCQGHEMCMLDEWRWPFPYGARPIPYSKQTAKKIENSMQALPNNVFIPYEDIIACGNTYVCAYIEDPVRLGPKDGLYGRTVKDLAWRLLQHGCQRCGHIPIGYPSGINNDDYGRFTVDVILNPCVTMGSGAANDNTHFGLCPKYDAVATNKGSIQKRGVVNGTLGDVDEQEELERIVRGEYGRPVTDEWELQTILNSTLPTAEVRRAMWAMWDDEMEVFDDDEEEWTIMF